MLFQHFIITRFCLRDYFVALAASSPHPFPPWKPGFTERRMRLIRTISGPSVMSQSSKNFTWVIVVEQDFPSALKSRIRSDLGANDRIVFHPYSSPEMFENTDWLNPYMSAEPEYLLTTNLDDDDMLSVGYVETLQSRVSEQARNGELPPIKIYVTSDCRIWSTAPCLQGRLGTERSATNPHWKYPTTGLSVVARYPALCCPSTQINHSHVERYLDFSLPEGNPRSRVGIVRQQLCAQLRDAGLSSELEFGPHLLEDLSTAGARVVMTDHADNVRKVKHLLWRRGARRVSPGNSFRDFSIDWDLLRRETGGFRALFLHSSKSCVQKARRMRSRALKKILRVVGS